MLDAISIRTSLAGLLLSNMLLATAGAVSEKASAAICSSDSTGLERALYEGWRAITYAAPSSQFQRVRVGDTWLSGVELAMLAPDQRRALADMWIAERDGTEVLSKYRERVAACGRKTPHANKLNECQQQLSSTELFIEAHESRAGAAACSGAPR